MKDFDTIRYADIAAEMGVTPTQGYRIREQLKKRELAKHLWPVFRAVYKVTGATPNDLIPYDTPPGGA